MEPYKIVTSGNKIFIKVLVYNERQWYPWHYAFVKIDGYPTKDEYYATDFKNIFAAEEWIKENGIN